MTSAATDALVRVVLEHLPGSGLVIFDRDLRVESSEGPAMQRLGYAGPDVAGRLIADVLPPAAAERLLPVCQAVLAGDERSFEYVTVDGATVLRVTALARRNGSGTVIGGLAVAWDATEHTAAAAALERSEALYRLLADTSTDVVTLHEPDGTCRYVSPSVNSLLGLTSDDVLGFHGAALVHPDDVPQVVTSQQLLLAGEDVVRTTMRLRHHDGGWVWAEADSCALRDADGTLREVRSSIRDLTQHKEHQARLQETADELSLRLAQTSAIARLGEVALEEPVLDAFLAAAVRAVADTLDVDPQEAERMLAGGPQAWERERGHDADFLRAVTNIVRDTVARRESEEAARHESLHDHLTGLPNRTLLVERLTQALARSARRPHPHAVVFLDVDNFKVLNDSLGHEVGDHLLCEVGRRLQAAVRPSDTVSRFGGDEFVVLCEDLTDAEHALRLAERICDAFRAPFALGGHPHAVSVSLGVVVTDDAHRRTHEVLRDADAAMYRAKDAGKGRYELFDADMRERAVARLTIEADLRRALARDEIGVHFQPFFRTADGSLAGFEALARWTHPGRGDIPPGEFIPVAEDSGLITALGTSVLRTACQTVARWNQGRERPLYLTVNVSPRQVGRPDLVGTVAAALEESGLDPDCLGLEFTEGLLIHESRTTATTIEGLKALGLRLVLDDFGTGYSSLRYLKRFPLDLLKIDRSFVSGVVDRPEDRAIVEAVIGMAAALQLSVIPEGVETAAQLDVVSELGCRFVQGFHLGFPEPADAIERRHGLV